MCMTGLPSLPPIAFRTMIRDKKAGLELSKTNFGSLSWRSLAFIALTTTAFVIVFGLLQ